MICCVNIDGSSSPDCKVGIRDFGREGRGELSSKRKSIMEKE